MPRANINGFPTPARRHNRAADAADESGVVSSVARFSRRLQTQLRRRNELREPDASVRIGAEYVQGNTDESRIKNYRILIRFIFYM